MYFHLRFLSHKHYFQIPLILSLPWLWSCSWGLESTVTVSLEEWVPGSFHLYHPAIKHFPPLSYLVIYHQLWSGVMWNCEALFREAVNICLHKQKRMTLTCALAWPVSRAQEAPAPGPSATQCIVKSLCGSSLSISLHLFPGMALFCLETEPLFYTSIPQPFSLLCQ